LNALYDAANQLASEVDRHPWKEDTKDKQRAAFLPPGASNAARAALRSRSPHAVWCHSID
jgi:hypothetical protein